MKARIIKTAFYSDAKVEPLSKDAKWLFMYCLTNSYIGMTGAFELTESRIRFETGLTPNELLNAKDELQSANLVVFKNDWVVVLNTDKHNSYNSSPKTKKPYECEFSNLPKEIQNILEEEDRVSIPYQQGMHTHRNKNTEIRKEKGGVGEKTKLAQELIDLFNTEFQRSYKLTSSRMKLIEHRLRTYEFHQLQDAVKKLARDPFYSGKNDRGWVATPDYLFRNDENVDKALNLEVSIKNKRKSLEDLLKEEA